MSTETNELNRLFNNISGETDDLRLPQTKWLQKINEWIEEHGIGGGSSYKGVTVLNTGTHINDGSELPTTYEFSIHSENTIESEEEYWGHAEGDEKSEKSYLLMHTLNNGEVVLTPVTLIFYVDAETGDDIYEIQVQGQSPITFSSVEVQGQNTIVAYLDNESDFNNLENALKAGNLIQGGSSYKGVTVLNTGTWIDDGEESQTLYVFNIWSDNPISSIEEYWGNGEKPCLLMHHLSNDEVVLTPVILLFYVDAETGEDRYGIQTPNGNTYFSSVEIPHDDVIEALLDNESDFNNLENALKAGSLIKSSSDEIIFPASGTADEKGFTLAIQAPLSMLSEGAFTTYLESAKTILWFDEDTGTIYLTPCKINIDNMSFNLPGNPINFNEWYIKRGTAFFNFDPEVKEAFIQGSIGGGSGGGSGGPNYQQPYSGTYGRDWYARILAETEPDINIKNLEVDENYMLLRLTYQENAEQETPIETKVFSIINIEEGIDSSHKTYYVAWGIENKHYIWKDGEDPIQTTSYLKFYPNIIGFAPEQME